jgi:D-alanine-D-alanine ligase
MRKKKKVLLTFDSPFRPEAGDDFKQELLDPDWKTERDVFKALTENGYDVSLLGLHDDIMALPREVERAGPDVIFNLTEVFKNKASLDKNVAWLFEILDVPYTGASPDGMLICNNKALSKKILTFHRIKVPDFYCFARNHRIKPPKRLDFPLIIKPLCEEASRGISQSSVVDNVDALVDRVKYIHDKMGFDAIVEEYIDGREIYIGVLGNGRITVMPPVEMKFGQVPEDEPRIATYKAKWDNEYRKRWGIKNVLVGRLPEGMEKRISDICRRAYKALNLRGYARFDLRVTSDFKIYVLEANANPCLAKDEDFAQAAQKAGFYYNKLIQKIVNLAFNRDKN